MNEYQLRREALLDAEVSAVQNGNSEEFYRINSELATLDSEFQNVQEIKKPSKFSKFGQYVLGGLAVAGLAMTGAAKDMAGSTLDDSVNSYFAESNDAQMVSDLDVNYSVTNGDYIASLEDNRFINIVDIETGVATQIRANDYNEVGSMNMDGNVLQFTTMVPSGDDQLYRLIELDLNNFQSAVITEEVSADEPDFYTQHDTDGVNNVYVDNGAIVLNGETVYNLGNNSLPSVNGDVVAFASEQTENNETTQSVVRVTEGESNTIYSGNQSVEFVDFMDGEIVYGLENLIDNKTVDLHVGNATRAVPSGMFDADNGNLTWIEQTSEGFEINLYNFETNQTESIHISGNEMRNPKISEDIVTWEQYELSDSFKAWYSDVADLITFESDVPVDNGTVDNGTIDNGTVDNGTIDNGTVDNGTIDNGTDIPIIPEIPETETTETERKYTDYLGEIAVGTGAGLLGIGYFLGKRRDKKMANTVASIVDDRLGAAASADELNRVSDQMKGLNEGLETYESFDKRFENLENQAKETQDIVDFLGAVEQPNYESQLTELSKQVSDIQEDVSSLKDIEQPNYESQLTELSEQVSGIQRDVSSFRKPKLPILKVDVDKEKALEVRAAELDDLEAKLKAEADKNKIKNVSGKLYWIIGGMAMASAAVYGEYTGAIDLVNLTHLRG